MLDEQSHVELVIGARMPLLGHKIERRPLRRWLGRVFANVAGLALGAGIYDTQCGAKLFRTSAACAELFEEPFRTRWIFDVEIFARMIAGHGYLSGACLEQVVYEYPLESWRDVAGSKLKSSDFVKSFGELAQIYWSYLRPGVSASPAVAARLAAAGHMPAGASGPLLRARKRPPANIARAALLEAASGPISAFLQRRVLPAGKCRFSGLPPREGPSFLAWPGSAGICLGMNEE